MNTQYISLHTHLHIYILLHTCTHLHTLTQSILRTLNNNKQMKIPNLMAY